MSPRTSIAGLDAQLQSMFFAIPVEIHRAIYSYLIPRGLHFSLYQNGFSLAPCVRCDQDDDPGCASRRKNTSDHTYLLRLQSSWGSHWRCEEAKQAHTYSGWTKDDFSMPLLRVCKRMFAEFTHTMADMAAFQINDVDTLRLLFLHLNPEKPESGSKLTSEFLDWVIPNIKELRVDLRLPLAAFEALEHGRQSALSGLSLISGWPDLPLTVARMSKLRRLRIWLDHDEPGSWSMVNERATLSPLVVLRTNPNLHVSVNLPKLHPKWESPDKHFTDDSPPSPIVIRRRYRQRCHAVSSEDGGLQEKHEPDFPVLYELGDWDENSTMEEVERHERETWKAGDDPRQFFRNL